MMSLFKHVCERIQRQDGYSFAQFMHDVLYAPNLGYYSTNTHKFGPMGDFVTAPELTPLFGYALANQCAQILALIPNPILFEFGAGSGRLCVDILTHLEYLNCLPEEYHILEVSADLRLRQETLIRQHLPHLVSRVRWLTSWPTSSFSGVVIANEVLDAMPVERFLQTQAGVFESMIQLSPDGELIETFQPCSNTRLLSHVKHVLADDLIPYQSEANLLIDGWIQQIRVMLHQGVLLLLDYGFPRAEYYHPDRAQGTLMCHYRHQAHTNPFVHLGEQDITAHVDFTHVAEAGDAAGFHVAGFTNQASFLLANGLLSLSCDELDERERVKANQAIKQLTQPNEMGELFKVMALTLNIDTVLDGFQWYDKRASL
jgi:SAM-dependent MidA family methyltransferase